MTFPTTRVAALAVLLFVPAMAQQSASRAALEFLRKKGDAVDFLDYDWDLNGR